MTSRTPFRPSRIDAVEDDLEYWLVLHARAGVPELVLAGLLREYAATIERRGFVPRSWDVDASDIKQSAERRREPRR